jgi:hypothetical protein
VKLATSVAVAAFVGACAREAPPAAPAPATVSVPAAKPTTSANVATAATTPAPDAPPLPSCGVDEIREIVCGTAAGDCPASVDDLQTRGPRGPIFPGDWGDHLRVENGVKKNPLTDSKGFVADPARTQQYVATNKSGPACCYSRCRHVAVTSAANGVQGAIQFCISVPEHGPSVPAARRPECPAAIEQAPGPHRAVQSHRNAEPGAPALRRPPVLLRPRAAAATVAPSLTTRPRP